MRIVTPPLNDNAQVQDILLADDGCQRAADWYADTTRKFLQDRSYKLRKTIPQRQIDIVRDVLNILPIHWVATEVAGLSLKTPEHPHGMYLESQLLQMVRDIYAYALVLAAHAKSSFTSVAVQFDFHGDRTGEEGCPRV